MNLASSTKAASEVAVNIQRLNGEVFSISAKEHDTTLHLKDLIAVSSGFSRWSQKLLCQEATM
eukprot:CAMPEP_0197701668 /NCGR_PEP_ID=MMETSP1338-20131121/123539_1 /TAXON_ID=43686 ORGANISM="Pelagodinium beii, Strain RCC1491" /NCGR_SAMPLE_ID=MMETSP1338 /ASSEMBLY_ACC=CAM_ASM_000754 /LENGTH=62 /DNA_ID=CAMNT_0043285391 /DNA_START=52 /DNA_END=237 /DNA_ORIENTATION=+